jgi:nucleosome binding factor SPN SPT16 subunit
MLRDGDLVLIDAGCELDHYASDITRTFPVSGKFSREQKALYEIVLAAQLAAINAVKPGNHWNEPHDATVRVITEGLVHLGLLKGRVNTLIKKGAYRDFYMHRAGHWLGMDVHDVGEYKCGGEWRVFEPGMVLTVEPGIYVSPHNKKVDKKWRGIGIRIEDDVVVTKESCQVLTAAVPKTVQDIESWMALQHPHLSADMDAARKAAQDKSGSKKSASKKVVSKKSQKKRELEKKPAEKKSGSKKTALRTPEAKKLALKAAAKKQKSRAKSSSGKK